MRPTLSDDQEFFRATTARFLDEFVPPAELRRSARRPDGFDRDYWRRGAELGWTSLLVSEDDGGGSISGDGLVDLTLVAHEFGAHAAPGPLVSANLVAAALSRAGAHAEVLGGAARRDDDRHLVRRRVESPPVGRWGHGPARGRRCRPRRAGPAGRVGLGRRLPAGRRSKRLGTHPGAGTDRRAGAVDRADAHRRPDPPLLGRLLRRRQAAGRRRRRRRSGAARTSASSISCWWRSCSAPPSRSVRCSVPST